MQLFPPDCLFYHRPVLPEGGEIKIPIERTQPDTCSVALRTGRYTSLRLGRKRAAR